MSAGSVVSALVERPLRIAFVLGLLALAGRALAPTHSVACRSIHTTTWTCTFTTDHVIPFLDDTVEKVRDAELEYADVREQPSLGSSTFAVELDRHGGGRFAFPARATRGEAEADLVELGKLRRGEQKTIAHVATGASSFGVLPILVTVLMVLWLFDELRHVFEWMMTPSKETPVPIRRVAKRLLVTDHRKDPDDEVTAV